MVRGYKKGRTDMERRERRGRRVGGMRQVETERRRVEKKT